MAKKAASKGKNKNGKAYKVPLAVGLCVISILAAFYLFYYYEPPSRIVMDWRVHIHFFDYRYGINYTPPANIGVSGGIWMNHTLDQYGPSGYAPLNTIDNTGTVHIASNVIEVYTFGDFFNIWGQPFNEICVPMPPLYSRTTPYCTGPGETVIYDPDNSPVVDSQTQVLYTGPGAPSLVSGTPLTRDPLIKYVDANNNTKYDTGETVVYDLQRTGYVISTDWIINATGSPVQGTPLKSDTTLRFIDANGDGVWLQPRTPPGMSDQKGRDSCINNAYGLSDNEDWIIFLYSAFAAEIQGNCLS